jgi:hypothetical protein
MKHKRSIALQRLKELRLTIKLKNVLRSFLKSESEIGVWVVGQWEDDIEEAIFNCSNSETTQQQVEEFCSHFLNLGKNKKSIFFDNQSKQYSVNFD